MASRRPGTGVAGARGRIARLERSERRRGGSRGGSSTTGTARTRRIEAAAGDLVTTIQMLARVAVGAAQPAPRQTLATLLDTRARRPAGSDPLDTRLRRMGEQVESDLGRDWNGHKLAQQASLSEEHLRRLCHRHPCRSPMAQLLMPRASTLLRSTQAKVEEVATRVSVASGYSFSAAFKRWSGVPFSGFRGGSGRRETRAPRHTVVGGMHLLNADERRLTETFAALRRLGVQSSGPNTAPG